ncbi:MAG: sigma-70 family RNA polymerase sigma factor [Myxococcota bacterium]
MTPSSALGPSDSPERLETLVNNGLRRIAESWPSLRPPDAAFLRYVGERLPEGDPADVVGAVEFSDLYLAFVCGLGDQRGLRAFEDRYAAAMQATARRVTGSAELADEVVQKVRMRLFVRGDQSPRILSYLGRGSLRAWVQVAVTRTALMELRSRGRKKETPGELVDDMLPVIGDPELDFARQQFHAEFSEAFLEAMAKLSNKERNILRYYLLEGLNIERIGKIYGAHRATVARWIAASRVRLLEDTKELLRARLGARSSEVDSLFRLMQSQLDLSIASVLRD